MCLLLLSAGLVKNAMFVTLARKLDVPTQHEIHDMVSHVIKPGNRLQGLDQAFPTVLYRSRGACVLSALGACVLGNLGAHILATLGAGVLIRWADTRL